MIGHEMNDIPLVCCGNCPHWLGLGGDNGRCERFPPTGDRNWPQTNKYDRCGEHPKQIIVKAKGENQ